MVRRRARQARAPDRAGLDPQPPPHDDVQGGEAEARWTHLMNAAFHLEQAEGLSPAQRRQVVRASLESALEAFGGCEPLEDFPGFAVRRLLLALGEALEEPEAPLAPTEVARPKAPLVIPPHLTPRR